MDTYTDCIIDDNLYNTSGEQLFQIHILNFSYKLLFEEKLFELLQNTHISRLFFTGYHFKESTIQHINNNTNIQHIDTNCILTYISDNHLIELCKIQHIKSLEITYFNDNKLSNILPHISNLQNLLIYDFYSKELLFQLFQQKYLYSLILIYRKDYLYTKQEGQYLIKCNLQSIGLGYVLFDNIFIDYICGSKLRSIFLEDITVIGSQKITINSKYLLQMIIDEVYINFNANVHNYTQNNITMYEL